ncbi:hypothetical protein GTN31_02515 [Macrococcoides canis]|uniref:hypothetical protein n=1 Tax=Macrococcoides canis TaxID=1855823 RepID=UPI0013E90D56|nr:hypothetical protein [Macrococcus canis]QIH75211.1 hypothetical protein GTN31_02515 [Macrococcus canis]
MVIIISTFKNNFNKEHFQEISHIIEFNYYEYHFFLCHYPVVDWNRKRYRSFHLYGHVHANKAFETILGPQSLNLSVANIDYKPISIDQVISIITNIINAV